MFQHIWPLAVVAAVLAGTGGLLVAHENYALPWQESPSERADRSSLELCLNMNANPVFGPNYCSQAEIDRLRYKLGLD